MKLCCTTVQLILRSVLLYTLLECKDLTARAALQDCQDSSYSRTCKEAHLACSQLVLEYQPNHFAWILQQRQCDDAEAPDGSLLNATESEAVVDIDHVDAGTPHPSFAFLP